MAESTHGSFPDVRHVAENCCFKNKGGKNSNTNLCGHPVWESVISTAFTKGQRPW